MPKIGYSNRFSAESGFDACSATLDDSGGTKRLVTFLETATAVDRFLLRVNRPVQYPVIAATVLHIIAVAIPNVPRPYVDYARFPLLSGVHRFDTYGTDTIGNSYVAKVVLNDPLDMYTKVHLEQTPLEKATWTREASAPYPPAALLTAAGLYAIGAATGIGFYGMVLLLAALFVSLSLWYCLNTRWYLFPLLYLNFASLGHRFVYVQDDSYLAMLVVVMIALILARARRDASHLLMALAITMKLSPAAYAWAVLTMRRRHGDDLCRHPVRRSRAPLFHLGQLPVHLHVPRAGQRQHLRHGRGRRAGRALHDGAVVRRDATRVRHGGSDRVVARSVRDVHRHQDASRPAPADRAPGAG